MMMLHISTEGLHMLEHKVLQLESSDASGFFNHMLAEPTTGLVMLANAKRKALYAVHVAGKQRHNLCTSLVLANPSSSLDSGTQMGSTRCFSQV
jgi:hypothetical protein